MAFFLSSIWFCFPCRKWIITLAEREQLSDCTKLRKEERKVWRAERNLPWRISDEVWQDEDVAEIMSSSGGWRELAQQLGWKAVNLDEKRSSPCHWSLSQLGLDQTTHWSVCFRPSLKVVQSLGGKVTSHNWHQWEFCWGCHWDHALSEALKKKQEQHGNRLYFSTVLTLLTLHSRSKSGAANTVLHPSNILYLNISVVEVKGIWNTY